MAKLRNSVGSGGGRVGVKTGLIKGDEVGIEGGLFV